MPSTGSLVERAFLLRRDCLQLSVWARVVRNSQERSSYHHHHVTSLGSSLVPIPPSSATRCPGRLTATKPIRARGKPRLYPLLAGAGGGAPSVIRNCRGKVLPQAAQVAPIYPSLCWPGEAGRCSRLVPTALVALGSLENRTHPGWVHRAPS